LKPARPAAYAAEFIGTFLLVLFIGLILTSNSPGGLGATDFAVIGLLHAFVLGFFSWAGETLASAGSPPGEDDLVAVHLSDEEGVDRAAAGQPVLVEHLECEAHRVDVLFVGDLGQQVIGMPEVLPAPAWGDDERRDGPCDHASLLRVEAAIGEATTPPPRA